VFAAISKRPNRPPQRESKKDFDIPRGLRHWFSRTIRRVYIMTGKKQAAPLGVRFSDAELRDLEVHVARAGIPRNRVIRLALKKYMAAASCQ
jgi:hypothetical protein